MSRWIRHMRTLFKSSEPQAGTAAPPPVLRSAPATEPSTLQTSATPIGEALPPARRDSAVERFEWLSGRPPIERALSAVEVQLLAHLDTALAADTSRADLLRRAPSVIPQLLNLMRDEKRLVGELEARIAKDPLLLAEVVRLANGAYASTQPVRDVAGAIARLGTAGLQRVVARVVLKPIFDAQSDPFSALAAPMLWQHAELTAEECVPLCAADGTDTFDGYLAGLMHNVGWTAVLRFLGRAGAAMPESCSAEFVRGLERRSVRLFALTIASWQLTDGLSALGAELQADPRTAGARSPLAAALREADLRALKVLRSSLSIAEPAA